MPIDARPTLAAPDDDPYLWLEDIDGPRALQWVEAQTAETLRRFGSERFARDRDVLTALWDRPDRIPNITRRGGAIYNFWQDAANPKGLWRRTTLESYREAEPGWEALLDLDALATAEGEDWIWAGAATLPPTHDRAILRLSRGGGDAVVLREFDIPSRRFVEGGFRLPQAKGGAFWLDRDNLLVSSALGAGMATRSGYARTVRLWRRGEDFEKAPILFETRFEAMSVSASLDRTSNPPRLFIAEHHSFFEQDDWFGVDADSLTRLEAPADAWTTIHRDWLVVKPRTPWIIGEATHAPDTLLGIRLSRFLAGARDFSVLFTPAERRSLQGFSWCGSKLVVHILDEVRPKFDLLTPSDGAWTRSSVPGLPDIGVVYISALDMFDEESNGEALVSLQDPVTPPSLLLVDLEPAVPGAPALLKRAPPTFEAGGLVVTRHEAISIDGERIPYVQVGPRKATGNALVHMTGYGGFGISEEPYYNTAIGKLWLERGGVSVTANIRGGGEFGTRWHDAGRREKKRLSHDDFAAVAADLAARGVAQPRHIAAEGGSNGGILISNMLTRYPERFGALFCTIPLIDMRRYTKLLAGASWIDEYGDPEKPEDWEFLGAISAYHTAVPGRRYPPILIATGRRDDRVHPGHARKMAAKLQAMGYAAYFYEPAAGGHGYGKDNKEKATFTALGLDFLWEKLSGEPT
jgi:prolyl oligopeptidase